MTYQIAQTCEACNNCKIICPIDDAIIPGDVYRIDQALCIECGACVNDCPSSSIFEPMENARMAPVALKGGSVPRERNAVP